ncbi:TPA_asm: P8 [Bouteloa betacytorhabdovirus 1]|nr:TPA_asm: P8 [Bouteloa betacytorhabdovirus 1]
MRNNQLDKRLISFIYNKSMIEHETKKLSDNELKLLNMLLSQADKTLLEYFKYQFSCSERFMIDNWDLLNFQCISPLICSNCTQLNLSTGLDASIVVAKNIVRKLPYEIQNDIIDRWLYMECPDLVMYHQFVHYPNPIDYHIHCHWTRILNTYYKYLEPINDFYNIEDAFESFAAEDDNQCILDDEYWYSE